MKVHRIVYKFICSNTQYFNHKNEYNYCVIIIDEETVKNAMHQLFAMERLICYKATDDRSTKVWTNKHSVCIILICIDL